MVRKLIRFSEKHGDRMFVFETEHERNTIVAQVARDRLREGYWYDTTPRGEPDLFRPTAHLSDAGEIELWLSKLLDPSLRRGRAGGPVPSTGYYLRQIYLWMAGRQQHQYEGFSEDALEECCLTVPL